MKTIHCPMLSRTAVFSPASHHRTLKTYSSGMVRTITSMIFLVTILPKSNSQNLVLNPGFEEMNDTVPACKYTKKEQGFNQSLPGWNTFNGLTPDLIFFPPGDSVRCIYPHPHGGNAMVGAIYYHPKLDTGYDYDYHEFIQGSLKNSLVPGEVYQIEFYIQQNDSVAVHHLKQVYLQTTSIFPTATNNLGFYFLTEKIDEKTQMDQFLRDYVVNRSSTLMKLSKLQKTSG